MKQSVKVEYQKKEYPELTREQIKLMVQYLNEGMSEEQAKAKVMSNE